MKTQLELTELGETQLRAARWFDAPPELVYRAHMDPELTVQWMRPPEEGWDFVITPQEDGALRYVWSKGDQVMPMTMRVLEAEPPRRILHTELFDEDWTGGETLNETIFTAQDGGTMMVLTITFKSAEGRAMAMASQMGDGMAASYDALEAFLAKR